nr:hypothetical protein [Tanacetum cinerariifolium]
MVNTRTDADLSAAVQNALQTLLPQIRVEICEEFCTSSRPSDAGGNPPPVTIHTCLERFNKQKPCCEDAFKTRLAVYKFEGNALAWWKAYKQAKGGDAWLIIVTWADFKKLFFLQFFPRAKQERLKREYHSICQTNTETSTEFMQRFLRLARFLGAAAETEEEQAKNFQWGLRRSTLNRLMCMSYTDVAQVANAARNYEILHERDDDDAERPDKRQKSGDRHQPTTQQSSHRNHGHNNDRHGSYRRGGGDNHRSNNNYSGNNNRETGVISPTDLPILVLSSPGVPLRATPTQFALRVDADTQESVAELLADKKPGTSGRVFAIIEDHATKTSGTITGTLFIYGHAVFVLFDTGATHSVISFVFASRVTTTPTLLDHVLCISTPMQDSVRITHVYRDLPLQFDDKIRAINALPLDMCEFHIILGTDFYPLSMDIPSFRIQ